MQSYEIHALTVKDRNDLRGNETTLLPTQIELLVKLDGTPTLLKIKAGMTAISCETFALAFNELLDQQLFSVV